MVIGPVTHSVGRAEAVAEPRTVERIDELQLIVAFLGVALVDQRIGGATGRSLR